MVTYSHARLGTTFAALAHPTRRAILARLALSAASVKELAQPFDMSRPAISKHLRVLEAAGLVSRERQGRHNRCRLVAEPMKDAATWISEYRRFWERQLGSLEDYFKSPRHRGQPDSQHPE